MTCEQLEKVMIYHLKNIGKSNCEINVDTILNTVLSNSDGYDSSSSKNIFEAAILWTMNQSGTEQKPWPDDWLNLSVKKLATQLI